MPAIIVVLLFLVLFLIAFLAVLLGPLVGIGFAISRRSKKGTHANRTPAY
jgi:hypothetical protein